MCSADKEILKRYYNKETAARVKALAAATVLIYKFPYQRNTFLMDRFYQMIRLR